MSKVEAIRNLVGTCVDVEVLNKELKRIASAKSRLKKQCGRKDYAVNLQEVELCEGLLKEARAKLNNTARKFTALTQEDVDGMDFEELVRALKSIQSKKSNSKWLTDVEGDNDEYRNAVRIEEMLKQRRQALQPAKASRLADIVVRAREDNNMSKEDLLELLEGLL